jgi:hypothetical protein
MDNKTIIALARIASGTAIFITSMVTGVNGAYQALSLLLLGVPIEVLQRGKEE